MEKAHFKLCKYSIKVGEKATNSAVMGELGRYPLFLEVLLNRKEPLCLNDINYFLLLLNYQILKMLLLDIHNSYNFL
jgi:hypothetical protein